jgi:hypothetical protein
VPSRRAALAAAAALLLSASALLALLGRGSGSRDERPGYAVSGLDGVARLAVGSWLETGAGERARLEIADTAGRLGTVVLDPGARLRLDERSPERHRLFLERGGIAATILATPGVFQVDTPAGLSVDLGCVYRLEVEGALTRVAVSTGMVAFESHGRRVLVPAGARCRALAGRGPGVPVWAEAEALLERLEALEGAHDPPESEVRATLDLLAERSGREGSSLSLWHLLAAASEPVRAAAFDRLAGLVPPPARKGGRAALVAGRDPELRDAWLQSMPWYRASRAKASKLGQ